MKSAFWPQTRLGKWSVGLQAFFVVVILISVFLVKVLGALSFDDRWWDITVLVFLAGIIAFFIGIKAVRKHNDRSLAVFISIFLGACTILFLLLHSLFIND